MWKASCPFWMVSAKHLIAGSYMSHWNHICSRLQVLKEYTIHANLPAVSSCLNLSDLVMQWCLENITSICENDLDFQKGPEHLNNAWPLATLATLATGEHQATEKIDLGTSTLVGQHCPSPKSPHVPRVNHLKELCCLRGVRNSCKSAKIWRQHATAG